MTHWACMRTHFWPPPEYTDLATALYAWRTVCLRRGWVTLDTPGYNGLLQRHAEWLL